MRPGFHLIAAVIAATWSGAAVAAPATATDKATGLTVTAPDGYVVRKLTPGTGQAAKFEAKLPSDTDTGCQIAFTPAQQNKRFSQAELDTALRGGQWQEAARKAVSPLYDISEATIIDLNGRPAYAITGEFHDRPELPARAKAVRTLLVLRETPRGRTSMACVGERTGFDTRRAEFVALATGVTTP